MNNVNTKSTINETPNKGNSVKNKDNTPNTKQTQKKGTTVKKNKTPVTIRYSSGK